MSPSPFPQLTQPALVEANFVASAHLENCPAHRQILVRYGHQGQLSKHSSDSSGKTSKKSDNFHQIALNLHRKSTALINLSKSSSISFTVSDPCVFPNKRLDWTLICIGLGTTLMLMGWRSHVFEAFVPTQACRLVFA